MTAFFTSPTAAGEGPAGHSLAGGPAHRAGRAATCSRLCLQVDHVRELVNGAGPWLAPDAQMLVELHCGQYEAAGAHAQRAGFTPRRHEGSDGQTTVLDLVLCATGPIDELRFVRFGGHPGFLATDSNGSRAL